MNLRESRKLKGLRQGQLAFLAGVTQGEISLLEHGRVKPSKKLKARIEEALGMDVDWNVDKKKVKPHEPFDKGLGDRLMQVIYELSLLEEQYQIRFLELAEDFIKRVKSNERS